MNTSRTYKADCLLCICLIDKSRQWDICVDMSERAVKMLDAINIFFSTVEIGLFIVVLCCVEVRRQF